MKVIEFHLMSESEAKKTILSVKHRIGIRGYHLIMRYIRQSSELDRNLILSKMTMLLCRFSGVMTCRLLLLDIKHHLLNNSDGFKATPGEIQYIERQLKRFISCSAGNR